MINDFLSGAGCFIRGFKLATRPELRRFVLIPLMINVIAFTAAIWFAIYQFDTLLNWLLPQGASWWAEYIRAVVWVFFAVIVLLILFFTFNLVANLLGAPFNGLLSEKVEDYLSGAALDRPGGLGEFISTILPSLISELKKIIYFLFTGIATFLFLLIPVMNIIAPFVWALFTSWMLALEYTAYPMENHKMYFSQVKSGLRKKRMLAFGFGAAVMIASTIPVVNFLVMPSAVAGATKLWLDHLSDI